MTHQRRLKILAAGTACLSLALFMTPSAPVAAQSFAPTPLDQLAQADTVQPIDPPSRVGRLSNISGTVSFHTIDQDQWSPAELNYPITTGNSFWTEPGARAP